MKYAAKIKSPAVRALSSGALMQAVYFLCGVVVSQGRVWGGCMPFGVALVAAVEWRFVPMSASGAVLGVVLALRGDSFRLAASVVAVAAFRWLFSDLKRVCESRVFSPIVAAAPLLCTGGVMIAASGKGSAEIVLCFAEAMLGACGAYFMKESVRLLGTGKGAAAFNKREVVCVIMTCCVFLLSTGNIKIGYISVGRILAYIAVMFCAYYGAAAGGCIGGTAVGVLFAPGAVPIGCAFGGLMAGMFSYIGKIGAAAAFLFCSTIIGMTGGITQQTAIMFYETAIASAIFLCFPKEWGSRAAFLVSPHKSEDYSDSARRTVIMRLDLASKAIGSINEAVNSVAKRLGEHYSEELDSVFERSIEECCSRCGMRAFCFRDVGSEEKLKSLQPILTAAGEIDENDITRVFSKRCCRSRELARSINESYLSYRGYLTAKARTAQIRGVVAGQFCGLGEILSGIKNELEQFESFDEAAQEKISDYLRMKGCVVFECSVRLNTYGRMSIEAETSADDRRVLKKESIESDISRLCGRRLDTAKLTNSGNRLRITLNEKPRLDVNIGTAQHICKDGRLCGDSLNYFNDGQGRFIAIISDGMGTGGRAAVDGCMAVSIVSKLIRSGLGFDAAMSAANSALMVKSDDESLATLDIMCIDLFSGETKIMKAGAPVTFIRRSGKVERVEPTSLPAGIMPDVRLTHDERKLNAGDIVVMVSDGAVAISDNWISAMMRDFEGEDIQRLVNDIIDEAMIGSKLDRDDDITVVGTMII